MIAVDTIRSGAHDPLIHDPDAIYIFIQMDRAHESYDRLVYCFLKSYIAYSRSYTILYTLHKSVFLHVSLFCKPL